MLGKLLNRGKERISFLLAVLKPIQQCILLDWWKERLSFLFAVLLIPIQNGIVKCHWTWLSTKTVVSLHHQAKQLRNFPSPHLHCQEVTLMMPCYSNTVEKVSLRNALVPVLTKTSGHCHMLSFHPNSYHLLSFIAQSIGAISCCPLGSSCSNEKPKLNRTIQLVLLLLEDIILLYM